LQVQRGIQLPLEVFKTKTMGYGLRCKSKIKVRHWVVNKFDTDIPRVQYYNDAPLYQIQGQWFLWCKSKITVRHWVSTCQYLRTDSPLFFLLHFFFLLQMGQYVVSYIGLVRTEACIEYVRDQNAYIFGKQTCVAACWDLGNLQIAKLHL
jgi:hypothetical protein